MSRKTDLGILEWGSEDIKTENWMVDRVKAEVSLFVDTPVLMISPGDI